MLIQGSWFEGSEGFGDGEGDGLKRFEGEKKRRGVKMGNLSSGPVMWGRELSRVGRVGFFGVMA